MRRHLHFLFAATRHIPWAISTPKIFTRRARGMCLLAANVVPFLLNKIQRGRRERKKEEKVFLLRRVS